MEPLELVWPPAPPEDLREEGRVVLTICTDPACQECPGFAYHWHAVGPDD